MFRCLASSSEQKIPSGGRCNAKFTIFATECFSNATYPFFIPRSDRLPRDKSFCPQRIKNYRLPVRLDIIAHVTVSSRILSSVLAILANLHIDTRRFHGFKRSKILACHVINNFDRISVLDLYLIDSLPMKEFSESSREQGNRRNYTESTGCRAARTPGQIHKGRRGSFVPLWWIAGLFIKRIYLQRRYLNGWQLGDVIAAVKKHDARTELRVESPSRTVDWRKGNGGKVRRWRRKSGLRARILRVC